jgi:hypothetical protein
MKGMSMTSDTSAPGAAGPAPAGRTTRGAVAVAGRLAGVVAVLGIAGVVGWQVAGPPWSGAAVVPPACPAAPSSSGTSSGTSSSTLGATSGAASGSTGAADQLVPMPLPEPRGPVSVRVCGYVPRSGGYALEREVVLDPTRTAALAALVDEHPGAVVPGARRPARCGATGPIVVLAFRYTQGPPVFVDVVGGDCGLVATAARVETGRQDVVRRLAEIMARG